MNFGKLYLVPNQLGDFNDNYVLKSHVALINKISFFIFENEKLGRAFIKNISPKKKQNKLKISLSVIPSFLSLVLKDISLSFMALLINLRVLVLSWSLFFIDCL